MKAVWNHKIVAESKHTQIVEGNHYFPMDSLNKEYLKESDTNTSCPLKGTASYYTLLVDGKENVDAAWYYPTPYDRVSQIKNHVAFWKGVTISDG